MRFKRFRIVVRQEFLDQCAEKNCCDRLDMHEQEKSRGEVIEWKKRHWVCTGSSSRGSKYLEANLQECVLEADYRGPAYAYDGWTPELYYPGGRLHCKGQVWIMTGLEVVLVPFSQYERR